MHVQTSIQLGASAGLVLLAYTLSDVIMRRTKMCRDEKENRVRCQLARTGLTVAITTIVCLVFYYAFIMIVYSAVDHFAGESLFE